MASRKFKQIVWTLCLAAGAAIATGPAELPSWAYPMNPPDAKPPVDDGVPRRVAGSNVTYTLTQLTNLRTFTGPDWHPQDHPPMPPVVAEGRRPNVFACAYCHRADGAGGPENASINGLPAAYIVQQMADYKSGARSSSVGKRGPTATMAALSKVISDEDVAAAAAYFSRLPPKQNIRVMETAQVPRSQVHNWIQVPSGDAQEPIGTRVLEFPEDLHQFELRDARATFVAYVPPGSLARGEALVRTGGGKTLQCALCHGAEMKGLGPVPGLAGRSPTYLARQMYDFQTGARAGPGAQLMKEPVARLNADDIVSIVAYLASLKP